MIDKCDKNKQFSFEDAEKIEFFLEKQKISNVILFKNEGKENKQNGSTTEQLSISQYFLSELYS